MGEASGSGANFTGGHQSPVTSSSFILVVQLPEGLLERPPAREREAVERLQGLLTDDPAHADRKRLCWDALSESVSNVVFTLVREETSP
ncbi:MAG: hypothetical protein RMK49_06940 [Abditibacteriales bacterium]|nr:hypothetical protein [Abditibacteriales bacterium]